MGEGPYSSHNVQLGSVTQYRDHSCRSVWPDIQEQECGSIILFLYLSVSLDQVSHIVEHSVTVSIAIITTRNRHTAFSKTNLLQKVQKHGC